MNSGMNILLHELNYRELGVGGTGVVRPESEIYIYALKIEIKD